MDYDFDALNAYALGYYEGRAFGVDSNNYDGNDPNRALYKWGYERGVSDYCALDERKGEQ
jgi:predicted Zn-dependent protease with MMP-like domain